MTTFELLVLVVGILVSLCASGFALLECSKLLRSVDGYKHYVGILEDLYKGTRAELAQTADEVKKVLDHVDNVIDTTDKILDHDRSVIEDVEKIKNDISMLQARLEDMDDNS